MVMSLSEIVYPSQQAAGRVSEPLAPGDPLGHGCNVHVDNYVGVPQALTDYLGVFTVGQHQSGAGVDCAEMCLKRVKRSIYLPK